MKEMKNKFILASLMALACQAGMAQDTYDLARLSTSDLNGTARYIGMGGAMGALGGDLSALGSNPAGLGIYRSNDIAATVSLNMLNNNTSEESSRASFDQVGAVFATKYSNVGSLRYVNFGFSYKKHKNFFDDYSVSNNWDGMYSQSYQIADLTFNETSTSRMPVLARVAVNAGVLTTVDKDEKLNYLGVGAYDTYYNLYQTGGIQEYDFSVAANIEDKFFLGASLGFYHTAFDRGIAYTEYDSEDYSYDMFNYYTTRGSGVDLKLGAIIRPIDDSNFRFGIALHTPTIYSLTDENGVEVTCYDEHNEPITEMQHCYVEPVDYQLMTPWKFNVSLGHTLNSNLALGLEYQLEDFSSIKTRDSEGYQTSFTDYVDSSTKKMLRTVHTLKLGAEYKVTPQIAVRAGYNYSTGIFQKDAFRDLYGFAADLYVDTFTETSWENSMDLHRLTCGVGYRGKHLYADMALQYTMQNADFYAFDDYNPVSGTYLPATEISKNRSQLSFTVGYKF